MGLVIRLSAPFGLRAVPLRRSVVVTERRAALDFTYAVGSADYIFTADIYAHAHHSHPERHLGWWRFELPRPRGRATLRMAFDPVAAESVALEVAGRRVAALDSWTNPGFAFDPLGDLELVMRSATGAIVRQEPALLKFVDRDILREFYVRQYATEGYTGAPSEPFLPELHDYKMRRLQRLFVRHFAGGGRVVDVGCGRSLFADMDARFDFRVCAGDLNYDSVHARAREVPSQAWAVFDAAALPFRDAQFDGLFAGEIIEHVPDVRQTLREWGRVLRPGGVAIVTTPNRERLVAVADGLEVPCSPDHLGELSYRELTGDLLPSCGFDVVAQDCLYLELWLRNLFNRKRVVDHLQRAGNRAANVPLMRRLLPLGRLLPWWSTAMIVVARKRG